MSWSKSSFTWNSDPGQAGWAARGNRDDSRKMNREAVLVLRRLIRQVLDGDGSSSAVGAIEHFIRSEARAEPWSDDILVVLRQYAPHYEPGRYTLSQCRKNCHCWMPA